MARGTHENVTGVLLYAMTDEPVPPNDDYQRDYVDTIVSLITGNLNSSLKTLSNESGIPELKTSLRALITNLEELYSNIKS